jgi:hypothetical protein
MVATIMRKSEPIARISAEAPGAAAIKWNPLALQSLPIDKPFYNALLEKETLDRTRNTSVPWV